MDFEAYLRSVVPLGHENTWRARVRQMWDSGVPAARAKQFVDLAIQQSVGGQLPSWALAPATTVPPVPTPEATPAAAPRLTPAEGTGGRGSFDPNIIRNAYGGGALRETDTTGVRPAGPAGGKPHWEPVPEAPGLIMWVDAQGNPVLDVDGGPIVRSSGQGGGGGAGRTLFPEERDLLIAQAEAARGGADVDRAREARLQVQDLKNFEIRLRELGLTEQANRVAEERSRREIALREQEVGLQGEQVELGYEAARRGARQGKAELALGLGRLGLETQTAEADRQQKLADIALRRDQATREILSRPSDVLARLFFQRGGTSPVPLVSQADLINRLSTLMPTPEPITDPMAGYRQYAEQLLQAPEPTRPVRLTTPVSAPPAAPTSDRQYAGGYTWSPTGEGGIQRISPPTVPGLGKGGYTEEYMFLVGDKPNGEPTGQEEMIINPTGAPVMVVPHARLSERQKMPRYALGSIEGEEFAPMQTPEYYQQAVKALEQQVPFDLGERRRGADPRFARLDMLASLPSAAPLQPSAGRLALRPPQVTQEALLARAREATPPGPAALLAGTRAPKLSIPGLALPSLQQYGRLTPDERESLRPRLATEFQTTLEDLTAMIEQRYGGTRTRPGARLTIR